MKRAAPLELKINAVEAYRSVSRGRLELYGSGSSRSSVVARDDELPRQYPNDDDEQPDAMYWNSVVRIDESMKDRSSSSSEATTRLLHMK